VECIENTPVGAEKWAVKSKVSSALSNAITGDAYTDPSSPVAFTIPVIPRPERPVTGTIQITATKFANADTETGAPAVCLYKPTLGARAASKTLTLVWTKKPADDCDCKDATVKGGPDPDCLGIDINGEGNGMAIPAWYQTRLQTLYGWREDFTTANTEITAAGELRAAQLDIELCDLATGELSACLADLYAELGDTTPGSPVTTAWDAAMAGLDADLTPLEALGTEAAAAILVATAGTSYTAGDVRRFEYGYFVAGTGAWVFQGYSYYRCIANGTTATATSGNIKPAFGTSGWESITANEALIAVAGDNQDINSSAAVTTDPGIARDPATFAKRYKAKMDEVRALAGIVPKSDAGSDGSACWRESDAEFYWDVNGGEYLPVSNNLYWHSCQKRYNADTGKDQIVSTHEFGFGLQISCENRLQEDDTITITIGDVFADYPYQIKDRYEIPLVAGGPIAFAGGVTGTDTLTWTVKSSTAGSLADYALNADEDPYSGGGMGFTINRGALDFALGDTFAFGVETGGRFRWRKDSAAWSADTAIADTVTLGDGLIATFVSGASPSFVADDIYRFSVRQPNSPNHVQTAHGDMWRWSGSTATLTMSWASDRVIAVVGLLRHGLSAPATVSIALKNSGGTTLQTLAPPIASGPLVAVLDAPLTTVRSIEIAVANADGMSLGWFYAGQPFAPEWPAALTWRRAYAMDRGDDINPRAAYLGAGRAGELRWEALQQADADNLLALIDHCKADGDAPVVVLPQALFPQDAVLARINSDAIEIGDWYEFQVNDRAARVLSLSLPLAAVLS
jgi:hypothetical protein